MLMRAPTVKVKLLYRLIINDIRGIWAAGKITVSVHPSHFINNDLKLEI